MSCVFIGKTDVLARFKRGMHDHDDTHCALSQIS